MLLLSRLVKILKINEAFVRGKITTEEAISLFEFIDLQIEVEAYSKKVFRNVKKV